MRLNTAYSWQTFGTYFKTTYFIFYRKLEKVAEK